MGSEQQFWKELKYEYPGTRTDGYQFQVWYMYWHTHWTYDILEYMHALKSLVRV